MPTSKVRANARAISSQIVASFRENIQARKWPPGTRLPNETDLVIEYKVSRTTIRQALGVLVEEGLIERSQRRGSFVREVAAFEEDGSTPKPDNLSGSHLYKNKEKRVGVALAFEQGNEFNASIMLGLEEASKARNYQLIFTFSKENQAQQTWDIDRLLKDQVAGIILFPVSDLSYAKTQWQTRLDQVPFVLIDRYFNDFNCDYVSSDNLGGGYRATEHLIILGHRKIGFVHSNPGSLLTTSVHDRWAGYRQALETYQIGYDETLVQHEGPWVETLPLPDIPNKYDEYLQSPNRPSAIFAVNDFVALALMQAARRCGLNIPQDLALVGFDNVPFAAHLSSPLTTVAQPGFELGVRASNLLLNRIEGSKLPFQHIELPTSLIVRESCGARQMILNNRSSS